MLICLPQNALHTDCGGRHTVSRRWFN